MNMGNGLVHNSSVPTPATMDSTKASGSLKQANMSTSQQQQQRLAPNAIQTGLPPASNSLFPPASASTLPQMADMQHQQTNLFMNGQSDMNQAGPYSSNGPAQNLAMNSVKSENQANMYDFQARVEGMNDFDQQQKDMMQISNDSLLNSLTQNHTQPQQAMPIPQPAVSDIKPISGAMSSPAMTMPPVSGGKPKAQSAAMAQVRNASSWSSLAGASQGAGQGNNTKSNSIGDSFQLFRRQAKEKEARQKALIEQQELRRQQKEQAERERLRAEADRRREREEEEALEKARYGSRFHLNVFNWILTFH